MLHWKFRKLTTICLNLIWWNYFNSYNDNTLANDTALLELDRDVTYTDHIIPACLPTTQAVQDACKDTPVITGWGDTEETGKLRMR